MTASSLPAARRSIRRLLRRRPPRTLVAGASMILFWILLAIFGPLI